MLKLASGLEKARSSTPITTQINPATINTVIFPPGFCEAHMVVSRGIDSRDLPAETPEILPTVPIQ